MHLTIYLDMAGMQTAPHVSGVPLLSEEQPAQRPSAGRVESLVQRTGICSASVVLSLFLFYVFTWWSSCSLSGQKISVTLYHARDGALVLLRNFLKLIRSLSIKYTYAKQFKIIVLSEQASGSVKVLYNKSEYIKQIRRSEDIFCTRMSRILALERFRFAFLLINRCEP